MHRKPSVWHTVGSPSVGDYFSVPSSQWGFSECCTVESQNLKVGRGLGQSQSNRPPPRAGSPGKQSTKCLPAAAPSPPPASLCWAGEPIISLTPSSHSCWALWRAPGSLDTVPMARCAGAVPLQEGWGGRRTSIMGETGT